MGKDINKNPSGGTETNTTVEEKANNQIQDKLNELKDKLDENQQKIQTNQIDLDTLKKGTGTLKGSITELENSAKEIDKAVDEYSKAYNDLVAKKTEIDEYHKYKKPSIILTDSLKLEIAQKKKETDENITQLEEKVKQLKKDKKSDERNKIDAEENLSEKQKNYDEVKNRKKDIEQIIADLKKLQKTIETFEEERKPNYDRKMYLLILDMEESLTKKLGNIESKEKLNQKLIEKWNDLATAKDDLRTKEELLNKHLDELKAFEKNLADTKKDRDAIVFDKISRIPKEQ